MGFGIGRAYYKLINRNYYTKVKPGLLFLNWIVQRIFRINSEIPFSVHYTSSISGYKNMKLGEGVQLCFAVSGCTNIFAFDGTILEIGEGTIFAKNICIGTANHYLIERNNYILKSVKIGENCWIGHGAVILPGVELGDNVTVGANAVVTKSFPANAVIAGVPADIIK